MSLKISVVIPTYNRRRVLASTLPSVLKQDFPREEFQVIVVVDGSSDGTVEMLREIKPACGLQIIEQPNRGQAVAKNAGARAARGELLLFLDDDIVCDSGLLRAHAEAHRGVERRLAFGPVYVSPESPRALAAEMTRRRTDVYFRALSEGREVRWPEDAYCPPNASVRRSDFVACGGFDERFGRSREEIDLGLRLWESGLQFQFLARAVGHQLYDKTASGLARQDSRWWGESEVLLCRKHSAYRPHSPIVRAVRPGWKWLFRQAAIRVPFLVDSVLAAACWPAERLAVFPEPRKVGARLLEARVNLASLRSAAAATGSWKKFRREFCLRLPVLLYHHVGPPRRGTFPELTISKTQFEREMTWLAENGYRGIRAAEWLKWLRSGRIEADLPVLITFDDAYADIGDNALPVLQTLGFGATIFVVTEQVGGTNAWDQVHGSEPHRLMTADQIRLWAAQGFEFGAHSRTHADLRSLSSGELSREVEESRRGLEEIVESPVRTFAYPYGYLNDAVYQSVRSGYDLAFVAEAGLNSLASDRYALRRGMVYPGDSLLDLEFRMRFGKAVAQNLRARWIRAMARFGGRPQEGTS